MTPRRLQSARWAALALLIFLCATAGKCDTFTDAMRGDDKRLETPVTITAPHILLGALLEALSRQTGVELKMNERDAASGVPLTVFCDKAPLGDIMSGVHSVLSFRPALWRWERAGKISRYVYELSEPAEAKNYPLELKRQPSEAFGAYAATMLALSRLSPEERRKNVGKILAALLQKDDTQAIRILDDKYTWACLNVFSSSLSPFAQNRALHGEPIVVKVQQMSPDAQAALRAALDVSAGAKRTRTAHAQ